MTRLSTDYPRQIAQILRAGSSTAAELMAALKISQPTLSRTIHGMSQTVTSFRVAGTRAPQYAMRRQLPFGLNPQQRLYRVLTNGSIAPFGDVEFLEGGGTLERIGAIAKLYVGLPPYMAFAAPSGFLGRQAAQAVARDQRFPASLKDWGDDHRVAYLFTRGFNLPGNLVFGDGSLQMEMELRGLNPTPVDEKASHYLATATALKASAFGSSAGGEQPKFLGLVEGMGHVIVKFAKLGSRMAELLPLEHLSLRSLGEFGVPASETQLLTAGEYVFLEVRRFDRVGPSGRVGMLSAGAVDDELFGMRDTWPEFLSRCVRASTFQQKAHVTGTSWLRSANSLATVTATLRTSRC